MQKGDTNRKGYFAEYWKNHTQTRITFKNSDYKVIEKIATKQGLEVASFIREATLTQAKNLYLFPKEIEDEIKKAVFNMRKIGNNINQIAKYVNEQQYSSLSYIENVFAYLQSLEKEIMNLKQKIHEKR